MGSWRLIPRGKNDPLPIHRSFLKNEKESFLHLCKSFSTQMFNSFPWETQQLLGLNVPLYPPASLLPSTKMTRASSARMVSNRTESRPATILAALYSAFHNDHPPWGWVGGGWVSERIRGVGWQTS